MPSYETLCIFHPELPETRVKELATWMQTIVENGQGTISKLEEWGIRDLAYRIKKQRRGYYILLEHDSEAATLNELERNLRLNEDILRFLSVVKEAPTVIAPTPIAQPSASSSSSTTTDTEPETVTEEHSESVS